MDDDLRKAFATLSSQINDVGADARNAAARSQEAVHGLAQLGATVTTLGDRVGALEHHVYGSNPPPPTAQGTPSPAPLVRQVSEHESELATVAGQVLAVDGKVSTLEIKINDLTRMQLRQLELLESIVKAVGGFFSKPLVRKIAWALGLLLLGWLSKSHVKGALGL